MKKIFFIFVFLISFTAAADAQGNAFSFQGKLNDGANPANGRYDLEFKLFDAVAGGTQIGPTVTRPGTTLINGVFSVALDFGAQAFQNPNSIFIEIAVKPNGSPNSLTILGPRQQLTVVPFASRSQNATNSDNSQNSAQLGGVSASEYITRTNGGADFIRNSTQPQSNSNFNISGNGTVNGNMSVGGNFSLVGNQTVNGSSNLGAVSASGNVRQARLAYGLPKAMIYVNANASIIRCYNGVTGESTGNCGYTVVKVPGVPSGTFNGLYDINFGIPVNDRFIIVTPLQTRNISQSVNIGAGFSFDPNNTSILRVRTFIPDVEFDSSATDNPFMIIVY